MLAHIKILIAIVVIGLIFIVIKLRIKKIKEQELKMVAEDKLRDQALNKALANDSFGNEKQKTNIESIPYEVDYNQSLLDKHVVSKNQIMLQITECSELSRRKFMIELNDHVKIGRAKENPIVIKDPKALPIHCEIFLHQNQVYIRDFSGSRTILMRKRQKVYVDEKGVKLKSDDKLMVENTILEVIIVNKME